MRSYPLRWIYVALGVLLSPTARPALASEPTSVSGKEKIPAVPIPRFAVGMNYAFPMAHFQNPLSRKLYLGAMVTTVIDYPLDGPGRRAGWGGMATLAFYPAGEFAGAFLIGGLGLMATRTFLGLEEPEALVSPTFSAAGGLRFPFEANFSFAFAAGINYHPVHSKRLGSNAPAILPAILVDFALGI